MIQAWLNARHGDSNAETNADPKFIPRIAQDVLSALHRVVSFPIGLDADMSPSASSAVLVRTLRTKFGVGHVCDALVAATKKVAGADATTSTTTLVSLQSRLAHCLENHRNRLDFHRVFGHDTAATAVTATTTTTTTTAAVASPPQRTLKLEICSGAGEWAASQAKKDRDVADWVTLELRHGRVYQTFARMVFDGVKNLCALGGDANAVMARHIAPGTFQHVFINHPEPPQQTGGGGGGGGGGEALDSGAHGAAEASSSSSSSSSSSQAEHLLTAKFLGSLVAAAMAPRGLLCICSDNLWYAQMLCRIVGGSPECAANFTSLVPAEAKLKVHEEIAGVTLFLGVPGRSCGVPDAAGASSYFNRMFQSGLSNHAAAFERYTLCLRRI